MSRVLPVRWLLASSNPSKLAEFREILDPDLIELVPMDQFQITSPPETGASFVENALLKARHGARQSGIPTLADDSGLVVFALGGEPGVRSARFAGESASDEQNIDRLLARLESVPDVAHAAEFHCVVVALRFPDDPAPAIGHGIWSGSIARIPRGKQGFGYDPIFVAEGSQRTAAELTPAEKNAASHRAMALIAIAPQLTRGFA